MWCDIQVGINGTVTFMILFVRNGVFFKFLLALTAVFLIVSTVSQPNWYVCCLLWQIVTGYNACD